MSELLTSDRVTEVFSACVAEDGDVEVDAIVAMVKFDKAKVEDHAEAIVAMLMELPEQFRESGGGGWSFLQACEDRHGQQWTGMHLQMGKLFALGQAAGMVECQLPRDLWDALPGEMPYYVIKDKSFAGRPGGDHG